MLESSIRSTAHDQRHGRSLLFDEISRGTKGMIEEETHATVASSRLTIIQGEGAVAATYDRFSASPDTFEKTPCPKECRCRCHRQLVAQPIPRWLSSWIGELYFPRTLLSSLWSAFHECNEWTCQRSRTSLKTVKYYLPTWFAQVEASVRFEALPLHFYIQTPRVVNSLDFLDTIGSDDLKQMLSARQITLHDTQADGYSLIHVCAIHLWIVY